MQHTVLYIDDTEADVELLRALLGLRGIHVDAALTGAKGITSYNPKKHNAIVIDWNLQDMSGLDAAKALLARHPHCRIAFISGLCEPEHISAAAAIGIDHCFEKQLNMEHIDSISEFVQSPPTTHKKQAIS